MLFALYGGWQTTNFVAAEIKDPGRNLSRALVLGVAGVIVLYLGVNLVCVRTLGRGGRWPPPRSLRRQSCEPPWETRARA